MKNNGLKVIVWILLTGLMVYGGMGDNRLETAVTSSIMSVIVICIMVWREDIKISRSVTVWIIWLMIMLGGIWYSKNREISLEFWLLQASGIGWWFVGRGVFQEGRKMVLRQAQDLKRRKDWSKLLIIVVTGLWTVGWVIGVWKPNLVVGVGPSGMVVEANYFGNHLHLGDWWAAIGMAFGGWWVIPTMAMVLVSRSRVAVIMVVVGMLYRMWVGQKQREAEKATMQLRGWGNGLWVTMILILGLWWTSKDKLVMGSRDYYVQTLAGLAGNPLGVGLGNFRKISENPTYWWWGRRDLALVTHNLGLDWIAGYGWLGIIGVGWLGILMWEKGRIKQPENSEGMIGDKKTKFVAGWKEIIWWTLTISFMLDSTYIVPAMWWAWWLALGGIDKIE